MIWLITIILVSLVLLCGCLLEGSIKYIGYEKLSNTNYIIKCTVQPPFTYKLFGAKEKTRKYIGWSTVWHDMETQVRPGTSVESWLADRMAFIEYQEKGLLNKKGAKK